MGAILFAASSFASLLVAAAVAAWGFGFVEPMWGTGGSFMVLGMISGLCSFAATIAFGLVSVLCRRFASNRGSVVSGIVSSCVATGALAVLPWQELAVALVAPPMLFAVAGGIASVVAGLAANNSSKPTPLRGAA